MNATKTFLLWMVLAAAMMGCRCLDNGRPTCHWTPNNWCWGETCATTPATAPTANAYVPPPLAALP